MCEKCFNEEMEKEDKASAKNENEKSSSEK